MRLVFMPHMKKCPESGYSITVVGDTIISESNEEGTPRVANKPNGRQSFSDKEFFYCECKYKENDCIATRS